MIGRNPRNGLNMVRKWSENANVSRGEAGGRMQNKHALSIAEWLLSCFCNCSLESFVGMSQLKPLILSLLVLSWWAHQMVLKWSKNGQKMLMSRVRVHMRNQAIWCLGMVQKWFRNCPEMVWTLFRWQLDAHRERKPRARIQKHFKINGAEAKSEGCIS